MIWSIVKFRLDQNLIHNNTSLELLITVSETVRLFRESFIILYENKVIMLK